MFVWKDKRHPRLGCRTSLTYVNEQRTISCHKDVCALMCLMVTLLYFWHLIKTTILDGLKTENGNRGSVVGIATRYGLDCPGLESQHGQAIFCSSKPVGAAQECFKAVMQPDREGDHSPPSRAEIKNEWSYTSLHPVRCNCVDGDNRNGKWSAAFLSISIAFRLSSMTSGFHFFGGGGGNMTLRYWVIGSRLLEETQCHLQK
jgi:hypothetical protein